MVPDCAMDLEKPNKMIEQVKMSFGIEIYFM
jgi:hypothetical protein